PRLLHPPADQLLARPLDQTAAYRLAPPPTPSAVPPGPVAAGAVQHLPPPPPPPPPAPNPPRPFTHAPPPPPRTPRPPPRARAPTTRSARPPPSRPLSCTWSHTPALLWEVSRRPRQWANSSSACSQIPSAPSPSTRSVCSPSPRRSAHGHHRRANTSISSM